MHLLGPQWIRTQPEGLLDVLKEVYVRGFNHLALNRQGQIFLSSLLPLQTTPMDAAELYQVSEGLRILLRAPHPILASLLAFHEPNRQTVAHEVAKSLQYQAKWTTNYQARTIALAVAGGVRVRMATIDPYGGGGAAIPRSPISNPLHQYLESVTDSGQSQDIFPFGHFKTLLLNGADANDYNSEHMPCVTAVLHHIGQGRLSEANGTALIELLVRHGADLRLVDGDFDTALHKAFRLGLEKATDMLIHLGADANDYNSEYMPCVTAVLHHIGQGRLSEAKGTALIELLVQYGADLRLVDGDFDTALHKASRLGLEEATEMLIRLEADVLASNVAGESTLHCTGNQKALSSGRDRGSKRYSRLQKALVGMIDAVPRRQRPPPPDHVPDESYI
ncbi:ankyrin repeat-containing domain protein [Ilyonectria destructans]|nr:ankyrin repeat-containing domain protein [Ilyonectria destructans]